MHIHVDSSLTALGIHAVVIGIAHHINSLVPMPEILENKIAALEKSVLSGEKDYIANDPITEGYRNLILSCQRSIKKNPPTVPEFVRSIKHRGAMPRISTIVDIYNMETLRSCLAIGGHDADKIHGTLTFTISQREDTFTSIGGHTKRVAPSDYCYRDDNNVIAWLGTRDSSFYKIDDHTQNAIFVIAGNRHTDCDYRLKALERIRDDLSLCMPKMEFETMIVEAQ